MYVHMFIYICTYIHTHTYIHARTVTSTVKRRPQNEFVAIDEIISKYWSVTKRLMANIQKRQNIFRAQD